MGNLEDIERQKEYVYGAALDLILKGIMQEVYDIRYGVGHSYWFYKNDKHNIVIERYGVDTFSESDYKEIYFNTVAHEVGHSLYTERSIKLVEDALKSAYGRTLPDEPPNQKGLFSAFNIVEDVRIEQRMSDDYGIEFWNNSAWLNLLDLRKEKAFSLFKKFYYLRWQRLHSNAERDKGYVKTVILETRGDYHDTTEWLKALSLVRECKSKDTTFERLIQIAIELYNSDKNFEAKTDLVVEESLENIESQFNELQKIAAPEKVLFDMSDIQAKARTIKKMFRSKCVNDSTNQASRKIDIRSFTLKDYDRLYVNKTLLGNGNSSVHICVDCSGSMRGIPIENAKMMMKIMSVLAQQRFIKGHISTSQTGHYEIYKLPMTDEQIDKIKVKGDEGFKQNFPKIGKVAKSNSYTFLFSDGNVVDDRIDQRDLNQLGVKVIGLYVGSEDNGQHLKELLGTAIIAETIDDLIYEMIKKVRS